MAPAELKSPTSNVWALWWDVHLKNSKCFRARVLCWVGAMIAGIGPVFINKRNVSHESYPVYFDESVLKAENATNSVVKIFGSLSNASKCLFNETQLLKTTKRVYGYLQQSYWTYSLQCTCETTSTNDASNYHQFRDCLGPVLTLGIEASSPDYATVKKCRDFVSMC
jgi:hypothetical protein